MRKIFLMMVFVVVMVVAGCTSKTASYGDRSFKEVCAQTGGMWMKMQPTQNYAPTGQPACFGCMQSGGDHICEQERYLQALQTQ